MSELSLEPQYEAPRGFLSMPKLPVAGLMIRLGALMIDIIVVLLAIWSMSRAFLPAVLASQDAYPYITSGFFFLYFFLLNGPLGGGRTVGKMLFRLQVTDYDGNPISYRQSIIRTAVLFPTIVTVPLASTILGDRESMFEFYLYQLIGSFPLIAVFLTTLIIIPFNPFKQGMHDFLGKTLVRPVAKPSEYVSFETMTEEVGYSWPKFYRQPQISGAVTFAMILTVLGILLYPGGQNDEIRSFDEKRFEIKKFQGYADTGISIDYPFPMKREEYLSQTYFGPFRDESRQEEIKAFLPSDSPTSGTISLVIEVAKPKDWTFSPQSPERLPDTNALSDYYFYEVLPEIMSRYLKSSSTVAESYAESLRDSPIELNIVFIREAVSSPFIFLYREPVETFTKLYPPIEFEVLEKNDVE